MYASNGTNLTEEEVSHSTLSSVRRVTVVVHL
jgi:hypothetical protein